MSSPLIIPSHPIAHVLLLTLSRPPLNAFNEDFWRALSACFTAVRDQRPIPGDSSEVHDEIRVVILASGMEKAFTAGLDLKSSLFSADGTDPARTALVYQPHILDFQAAISSIAKCGVPVISAVHGFCIGLGVDIISAGDIRVCAENTKFAIREAAIGLAADIGSLQRVPKLTGNDSLVRELALTGRFFSPQTALQLGLVSRVVKGSRAEVLATAMEIAEEIADLSPIATRGTKHLLDHAREHSVDEGLAYTALWNSAMLQATDLKIAMGAFGERKNGGVSVQSAPTFPDLFPKKPQNGARDSKL